MAAGFASSRMIRLILQKLGLSAKDHFQSLKEDIYGFALEYAEITCVILKEGGNDLITIEDTIRQGGKTLG